MRQALSHSLGGRNTKAQGLTEYLATYGWSIVLLAVIVGALFQLGIIGNTSVKVTSCVAIAGYVCSNPMLSNNGNLNITFSAPPSIGTITIIGTGCSSNATPPSTVRAGGAVISSGQNISLSFDCPLPSSTLGSQFSGSLWIEYNTKLQSRLTARIASITVPVTIYTTVYSPSEYTLTTTSCNGSQSCTFDYGVTGANTFVVLAYAQSANSIDALLPSGCAAAGAQTGQGGNSSAFLSTCDQQPGTYSVTVQGTGGHAAMAAYVFSKGTAAYYTYGISSAITTSSNGQNPITLDLRRGYQTYICAGSYSKGNMNVTSVGAYTDSIANESTNIFSAIWHQGVNNVCMQSGVGKGTVTGIGISA